MHAAAGMGGQGDLAAPVAGVGELVPVGPGRAGGCGHLFVVPELTQIMLIAPMALYWLWLPLAMRLWCGLGTTLYGIDRTRRPYRFRVIFSRSDSLCSLRLLKGRGPIGGAAAGEGEPPSLVE